MANLDFVTSKLGKTRGMGGFGIFEGDLQAKH